MSDEKKVNHALIEQAMRDFRKGAAKYRKGLREGTIEHPHDSPHTFVPFEKQDDHFEPLPINKKD